jgi:hypothetical protein
MSPAEAEDLTSCLHELARSLAKRVAEETTISARPHSSDFCIGATERMSQAWAVWMAV